jgi:hypothetical protein
MPARRDRRRRDDFGVAVRDTNPRRIIRYATQVEIALPFDDAVATRRKKSRWR